VPSRSSPIIMVQTAEHGDVHDLSIAARRVRRAEWDKLTDPLMRPSAVEIRETVFAQDALQVALTEHNDVVQALAANAAQKSFAE
jgi:hypothetical protein